MPVPVNTPGVRLFVRVSLLMLMALALVIGWSAQPGPASAAFPVGENFDAETVPNLPVGWTAITAIDCANSNPWATSAAGTPAPPADTPANAAFVNDPNCISDERLTAPAMTGNSNTATITFRQNRNLENGFDGGVFEISVPTINGGAFTDIIAAGGTFMTGGYNGTISVNFGSPIAGRQAWTGNSAGFVTTTVNLPAAVNGQAFVVRWRRGTDSSVSGQGWRVDSIAVTGVVVMAGPPNITITADVNPKPTVSPNQTITWTFVVTNNGATPAPSTTFNATLPSGLQMVTPSAMPMQMQACTVTNGGQRVGCALGTLGGMQSVTITITARLLSAPLGSNLCGTGQVNAGAAGVAVTRQAQACTRVGLVFSLTTQATVAVGIGGMMTDVATIANGSNPTGTLTFNVYGPDDAMCTGMIALTSTVPVAGNGMYTSAPLVPAAVGTYRWVVIYSGDVNNAARTSPCNAPNESTVVTKVTPTLTTQASADTTLGNTVSDTANLTIGFNPTGTLTFNLFGPNDAMCMGASVFTAVVPVAGNGMYSSGTTTPIAPGTYRWTVVYSGDLNNFTVTSPCNAANESVTVT